LLFITSDILEYYELENMYIYGKIMKNFLSASWETIDIMSSFRTFVTAN